MLCSGLIHSIWNFFFCVEKCPQLANCQAKHIDTKVKLLLVIINYYYLKESNIADILIHVKHHDSLKQFETP